MNDHDRIGRERFLRICQSKLAAAYEAVAKAEREVKIQGDLVRVAEAELAALARNTPATVGPSDQANGTNQ